MTGTALLEEIMAAAGRKRAAGVLDLAPAKLESVLTAYVARAVAGGPSARDCWISLAAVALDRLARIDAAGGAPCREPESAPAAAPPIAATIARAAREITPAAVDAAVPELPGETPPPRVIRQPFNDPD